MVIGAILSLVVLSGTAAGDRITVTTSARVIGNFQEHSSFAMDGSGGLAGASEDTMAVNGETTYVKTEMVDTDPGNGGSTLELEKTITFNGTGTGGRMVSGEDVLVGTVADSSAAGCAGSGAAGRDTVRTGTVSAGSRLDVTEVSAHTSAKVRAVSDETGPVSLEYEVSARGLNQTGDDPSSPAIGSASVSVDVHTRDARGEVDYEQVTSVDGLFQLAESASYSSGEQT